MKKIYVFSLIFSIITAWPTAVFAASTDLLTPSKLGSLILSVIFVIIAIVVVLYVLKRLMHTRNGFNKVMKIKSAMAIGNKERLVLVEVSDKTLLLGVTPQQISRLHVFDEPLDASTNSTEAFPRTLRSFMNKQSQDKQSR